MTLVRPRVMAFAVATLLLPFAATAPARAENPCIAALEANFNLHSYRATMTSARGTQTIDLVVPDRVHMVGKGMEFIAIGTQTWMRMGGANWTPMPGAGMNASTIFATARANLEANKTGGACVDAGAGSYDGKPAHIFTYSHLGASGNASGKAYVLPDGYVHRVETTGPTGTITMDFSKFNSVSVSPP